MELNEELLRELVEQAVYVGLLLVKAGLKTYCETGEVPRS